MAQEYKPGRRSSRNFGIYIITHDPAHADMPYESQGRCFPTCRHSKGIAFMAHAARHVSEIDHLEEAHAPAQKPFALPPWRGR